MDDDAESEMMDVCLQEILRKLRLAASVLACMDTETTFTERGTTTMTLDGRLADLVDCGIDSLIH